MVSVAPVAVPWRGRDEKKTYPPGVPCWVETLQPDPRAALEFYGALFGWDGIGPGPMPDGGEYFVARLHGDDVAGIATLPPGGIAEPAWTTYVRVDELEAPVRRVLAAGGRVIVAPLDAPPAGRIAIVEAPTGATFGLWEPGDRAGAQRINEPGAWAMSALRTRDVRGGAAVLRNGLRMGRRTVRRCRCARSAAPASRIRRRASAAARSARRRRGCDRRRSGRSRNTGPWTSGSTTSMPRSSASRNAGAS